MLMMGFGILMGSTWHWVGKEALTFVYEYQLLNGIPTVNLLTFIIFFGKT